MSGNKTLIVPSFDYAAFFYPELLDALIAFKRTHVPELTDESDQEPSIQMLRAFACVGHLNNVLLDMVANENTIVTAKLPSTIRNMLRLINYELQSATPSQVDVVYKLSSTISTTATVVPADSQMATKRDGDNPIVYFEAIGGISATATDVVGKVLFESAVGVFTDFTTQARAGTAWATTPSAGCKYYFGHPDVMFDAVTFGVPSVASNISNGAWEYYDGSAKTVVPDSVTDIGGGSTRFNVNSLLGAQNRTGALVRIWLNSNGRYEDLISAWDGSNNYVVASTMGQSSPSYARSDYTSGTFWTELSNVEDGSSLLKTDGDVKYDLPQTLLNNWSKTTVNSNNGYFVRYRVISTTGAGPTLGSVSINSGKQYVLCPSAQGRSVIGETLGSSNGSARQSFNTGNKYFISGSEEVRVNGVAWTRVDNFLNSNTTDTHYKVELGDYDRASIVFGDGNNGKIPDVGQNNIIIDYKFGANDNGNVGALTVSVDKSGLSFVESLWNPRPASGWAEAQSASTESLELAKLEGPATLAVKDVAIGPDDVAYMAVKKYKDDSGSSPFSRAKAIEESFGLKTIEVVVFTKGGGQATDLQLGNLSTWFNGDKYSIPKKQKRLVSNYQVTATNSTTRPIDITAVVTASSSVTKEQIVNQLINIIQPEAMRDGGVEYVWDFGAEITPSRIEHEIFSVDSSRITNVSLTTPSTVITLGSKELPTAGTISITVITK